MQTMFWAKTNDNLPKMTVVPDVPREQVLDTIAFGDKQFLYRLIAFQMGNLGDSFGRNTALRDYDLSKVKQWFIRLYDFDNKSNLLPSLASYYFSQTQDKPQVIHMVEYLQFFTKDRPDKWWWQAQAAYLAMHKLEDNDLALEIAKPLKTMEGIPMWARQTAAFVYEKKGEMDSALDIMENILENAEEIPPSELNFMKYFVEERLNKMNELNAEASDRLSKSTYKSDKASD